MQQVTFSGQLCADPLSALDCLPDLRGQILAANSLMNPLGQTPARGWFLLRASQLDQLNLDADQTATFNDAKWGSVTAVGLVVTREPVKTHVSVNTGSGDALYLVEVSDRRWLVWNPWFQASANKLYNVRARGWGTSYYDDSRNAGSDWTWSTMLQDLWGTVSTWLGSWPGLPVSPSGTPEEFKFQGVPAWTALCEVLYYLGCAVRWDAGLGTYSIVQLGSADAAQDSLLTKLENSGRLLHDSEYRAVTRGKVPGSYRVFFHSRRIHQGTERTTPKDSEQWLTSSTYTVDVNGSGTEGVLHPLWGDLPALYDATGTLTNAAALATRAAEIAADHQRHLTQGGGGRFRRIYDGACSVKPAGAVKGVTWRQNPGGIVTEVVRHPARLLKVDDQGGWCECPGDSTHLHPPDLRATFPTYPGGAVTEFSSETPTSDLFDGNIETLTTAPNTFTDEEQVKIVDLDGAARVGVGDRRLARLVNYDSGSSKPIWAVRSGYVFNAPLQIRKIPSPGTPPADFIYFYVNIDGDTILVLEDGTEINISNSGGGDTTAGVRAKHSTSQSVASGATDPLEFDEEQRDDGDFHDTVSNNTRLTVPADKAGWYSVSGGCTAAVASSTLGGQVLEVRHTLSGGGQTIIARSNELPYSSTTGYINVATHFYLEVGDYLELLLHNSTDVSSQVSAQWFAMKLHG